MELENLPSLSDSVIDKLLKGINHVSNFLGDSYRFSSAKNNYLEKISHLQYVRTLNEFEESVSLYDFYVPPHLANLRDKKIFQVNTLDDIKAYRKILISGIVGQGKSVLMRHLAISEVINHNRLPLFYELRYLQKGQNLDHVIKNLFNEWLEIKSSKVIENILSNGDVTIFLDGFDELHIDDMPKIVLGFDKLLKKYPKLNFIVSSRPENIIESSTVFQNYQIQKLDIKAQKNIINALIKNNKMQQAVISGVNNSNVEVKSALITPLMVNLFVFIYKHEKVIPEHVKDFYDRLFDLVLRKHDNTKIDFKRERATGLSNDQLRKILQLISFMCCKQEVFAFDESVLRRLVYKAIEINKLNCSLDDLIYDLTGVLCFIVKEGYLYAFIHKSIPEYFAAEFIRDSGNSGNLYKEIYNKYDKFEKVASFLKVIDEYNYNNNLLKIIFNESLPVIRTKNFISTTYFSFNTEVPNLRIVFMDYIHDYFSNYLRNKTSDYLIKDIQKNYPSMRRFSVSVISKSKDEEYEAINQDGVYNDYYSSFSDTCVKEKINENSIKEDIEKYSFKKIQSVTMSTKFSNTLRFLNSYVADLEKQNEQIQQILKIHTVDDYSF
jgi:hypothetical protein